MPTAAPGTRAQALATEVERTIAADALRAGDRVGTIDGWQDRSGFGRATVSEAVRLLVDRGVVEVRPGRGGGVFVARTGPVVRLRHTLLSVHGEGTTLADAIAIREALEPLLVTDAARCRTAVQVRRLRRALRTVAEASGEHDAFVRAIWTLHEDIAQVTPNEMLRAIYLATMQVIEAHAAHAASDEQEEEAAARYRAERLDVHRELVDSIADGDLVAVSRALERHHGVGP